MKIRIILFLLTIFVLCSCSEAEDKYVAGTYIGEAEGYHSIIQVEVTVDKKHIQTIRVLKHEEAPILSDVVIDEIPKKVIKKNSTDVDIISGATYTSETLLKAIDNALEEAYIDN